MKLDQPAHNPVGLNPRILAMANLIIATGSLILGYLFTNLWFVSLAILILAGLWLLAAFRSWTWVPTLIFVFHVLIAGLGFYLSVGAPWLLLGMLSALFTWDIHNLDVRYNKAGVVINQSRITLHHLRRLLLIEGIGMLLVLITFSFQLELEFGWLIGLGLIVAIGLSYVINYLLKTGQ